MVSIYVGNLPFRVTEDEVASLFSEFGEVQRVHLVMDRETGRPRGFGFVEMGDDEGRQAIQELMDRNAELGGRPLKLNEAQPREERGGGGFRGGGGGFAFLAFLPFLGGGSACGSTSRVRHHSSPAHAPSPSS